MVFSGKEMSPFMTGRSKKVKDITGIIGVLVCICFLFGSNLAAQHRNAIGMKTYEWTATFGGVNGDVAYSVQETRDRGFIIGGVSNSYGPGKTDLYFIRTDSLGKKLWSKTYGGAGSDFAFSVLQTIDNGFVAVGYTRSLGEGETDIYIVRTDENGDILWSRTYGGKGYERASSIQPTTDDGYIIAGWTASFGAGGLDIYMLKITADGAVQWSKTYGGQGNDYGYSVKETYDGGYIIAGFRWGLLEKQSDMYVIKTDKIGNVKWSKTYGGSGQDYGRSIQETPDGGYIVAGYTNSFGSGSHDMFLVRIDSLGDTLWTKVYGGEGVDICSAMVSSPQGGYVLGGWTTSFGAGEEDVYFVEVDSMGNELRARTYGGDGTDQAFAINTTADGGFIISGFTRSFGAQKADVYLVRISAQ